MAGKADRTASCPLCGDNNNCGNLMGLPEGSCWCSKLSFPKELLERVLPEALNKACICQDCLDKQKQEGASTPVDGLPEA